MKRILLILNALLPFLAVSCSTVADVESGRLSLNGTWDVAISDNAPRRYRSAVQVPGLITMAVPSLGDNLDALDDTVRYNYVWYRRKFTLSSAERSGRAMLHLRARYNAEVYLNGKKIGYDAHCTYSHAVFDVSDAIRYGGENTVVVRVGSWNTATVPSKENSAEWWRSTRAPGIWDDAFIEFSDAVAVENVRIQPSAGKVRIETDICNTSATPRSLRVRTAILDGSATVCSSEQDLLVEGTSSCELTAEMDASGLEFWTPGREGNAKLYNMEVSLLSEEGELISRRTERFGYRYISVKGGDVLLNGSKIFFRAENIAFVRALNRWAEGLYSEEWLRGFIRSLVQDYNFNYIRVHLGHAYGRLYDIADEEGLMIQDEWRFMHDSDPEGQDLDDTAVEFRRWIAQNYNHPSIVAWDQENEGNVRLTGLIRELRAFDPTRLWSEQDFIQKHIYEYSEREVRDFEGYRIPREKPYTILESCRLWTNEFGELELREDFKTSRTASGWHLYFYTKEDLERLLADIHADMGTFYRCSRIQAWSPFAVLSGRVNGHNFFKGDIIDSLVPQENLLVLKRLNEPVGTSIRMNQAVEWYDRKIIYTPGCSISRTVSVWNDFGTPAAGELSVEIRDDGGRLLKTVSSAFKVEPYACSDADIDLPMPELSGVYYATPRLRFADGRVVDGVTRRFMVGKEAVDACNSLAFGGRHVRPEGGKSILENYTRTAIPDSVQANIIRAVGDRLVDKVKVNPDGGFDIQTSYYETSKHIFIASLKFDRNGRLVSSRESEAMPYVMLPVQIRQALVKGIGAVPQDEARVTVKPGSGESTYEIKVVGFDHKFRMVITDDGILKSTKFIN